VYYFPGYHSDPATTRWHGRDWTEWELVRHARPRYEGHDQPKVPLWGEFDESTPYWAERQSRFAADHGVDFMIFDWYWYQNAPFLNGALDRGFLAHESLPTKFAIMWANHDWLNIHPASAAQPPFVLFDGTFSDYEFDCMAEELVEKYFTNPGYELVDGEPYFSIYQPSAFVDSLGGIDNARRAVDRLRERTRQAGFPGLHLNLVSSERTVLPNEAEAGELGELVDALGAASSTSYVWIHHYDPSDHGFPLGDYWAAAEVNFRVWDQLRAGQSQPYYPNVTVGWDSSPRVLHTDVYEDRGYPWLSVLEGNTPERFGEALGRAFEFVEQQTSGVRIITLNAWNEWTEGSYLLPDARDGARRLEALQDAVAAHRSRVLSAADANADIAGSEVVHERD